jgi:hypothetical protein
MKQHQKIEKNITTPTIASLFWGKIMQEIKMFMFHIPKSNFQKNHSSI